MAYTFDINFMKELAHILYTAKPVFTKFTKPTYTATITLKSDIAKHIQNIIESNLVDLIAKPDRQPSFDINDYTVRYDNQTVPLKDILKNTKQAFCKHSLLIVTNQCRQDILNATQKPLLRITHYDNRQDLIILKPTAYMTDHYQIGFSQYPGAAPKIIILKEHQSLALHLNHDFTKPIYVAPCLDTSYLDRKFSPIRKRFSVLYDADTFQLFDIPNKDRILNFAKLTNRNPFVALANLKNKSLGESQQRQTNTIVTHSDSVDVVLALDHDTLTIRIPNGPIKPFEFYLNGHRLTKSQALAISQSVSDTWQDVPDIIPGNRISDFLPIIGNSKHTLHNYFCKVRPSIIANTLYSERWGSALRAVQNTAFDKKLSTNPRYYAILDHLFHLDQNKVSNMHTTIHNILSRPQLFQKLTTIEEYVGLCVISQEGSNCFDVIPSVNDTQMLKILARLGKIALALSHYYYHSNCTLFSEQQLIELNHTWDYPAIANATRYFWRLNIAELFPTGTSYKRFEIALSQIETFVDCLTSASQIVQYQPEAYTIADTINMFVRTANKPSAKQLINDINHVATRDQCDFITAIYHYHDDLTKTYHAIKNQNLERKYAQVLSTKYNATLDDIIFEMAPTLDAIIQEGKNLRHCVASYTERVALGKTGIIFIREEKDTSWYTAEVQDGHILQIHGLQNRRINKDSDLAKSIMKWAKLNHLQFEDHVFA